MATNADMSLKEFAKEMLVEVKKDQEWLTRQKEITGDLQERIDECFKRVQKCDMTKGVYSTTQMAKELGMSSAQKLYEELKEVGLAFNQGYEWMLASPYSTYQLTEVTTHLIKGKYTRRPLWTERGRRWLLALKEKNIICNLPKPRVPKAVEKCIASQSGEKKYLNFADLPTNTFWIFTNFIIYISHTEKPHKFHQIISILCYHTVNRQFKICHKNQKNCEVV